MRNVIIVALLMLSSAHYTFSLFVPEAYYQPEIELDFENYRNDPEKMDFLIECVLRSGECDEVGEWVKARILLRFKTGQCKLCTRQQAWEATKFVNYFMNERQDLRQEATSKYLQYETLQHLPVPVRNLNSLQNVIKKPVEEVTNHFNKFISLFGRRRR